MHLDSSLQLSCRTTAAVTLLQFNWKNIGQISDDLPANTRIREGCWSLRYTRGKKVSNLRNVKFISPFWKKTFLLKINKCVNSSNWTNSNKYAEIPGVKSVELHQPVAPHTSTCVSFSICACVCVCFLIITRTCVSILTESRGNKHSDCAHNHTTEIFLHFISLSHTHTHQSISHLSPVQPFLPTLGLSVFPCTASAGLQRCPCVFTSLLLQSEWKAERNNLKEYLQQWEGRMQQKEKLNMDRMSFKVSVGLLSVRKLLQTSFISVLINYCELGGKIKRTAKTKRCMLMCGCNHFL